MSMYSPDSVAFNIDSSVKFEWIPGGIIKLMQTDGVGNEIKKHTENVYRTANSLTPNYPNMYNNNYYHNTFIGGKLPVYRGRVWCGNIACMHHNYKTNALLKAMSGA